MKLLIVSATENEILPSLKFLKDRNIDVLISGVGMQNTIFELTKVLCQNEYDLVINAGIAGSFKNNLKLGNVVQVEEDRFSEFGVEDGESFKTAKEVGLCDDEKYNASFNLNLKNAKGITVNKVHGNEKTIEEVVLAFNPDVESMEGAAVFFVCDKLHVKCAQIRAISNKVERRNKNNWDIPLAINNLNTELQNIISNTLRI